MNERLLTGLKLDNRRSKPAFLRRAWTIAVFHLDAKMPLSSDRFTILMIGAIIVSRTCLTVVVGIASNSHDLLAISVIHFVTSFTVTCSNLYRNAFAVACRSYVGYPSRLSLILSIFSIKKSINPFASMSSLSESRKGESRILPMRWFTWFYSFLTLLSHSLIFSTILALPDFP